MDMTSIVGLGRTTTDLPFGPILFDYGPYEALNGHILSSLGLTWHLNGPTFNPILACYVKLGHKWALNGPAFGKIYWACSSDLGITWHLNRGIFGPFYWA